MFEPMNVIVEAWPVAADETGLWLVSGDDAWRYGAVMADSDVHFEVEMLLAENGIGVNDRAALHSTSWRPDGPHIVLTYMAVIDPAGLVLGRWPDALPVTADLVEAVGKPPTHAANRGPRPALHRCPEPWPEDLKHLMEHDATNAAAMGELWERHLEPFAPALAGMYSERHAA